MKFLGIAKMIEGLQRGAEKFGSKVAEKAVKKVERRNGYAPTESEPYGLGMGGGDTEQMSSKSSLLPGEEKSNVKIGIPPAQLRQQNKLDFLKRELPLSQDKAERDAIEYEIKQIEKELSSMPKGDPDARSEKKTSFANEDSSNLGFESEQKTTTAQRSKEGNDGDMLSKCLACGHESKNAWSGKCESCLRENAEDVGGNKAVTKDDIVTENGSPEICAKCNKAIDYTPKEVDGEMFHEKCAPHSMMANAGHLTSEAWMAASTDERAVWLDLAHQDINLATKSWVDLSSDLHVALQDAYEMPSTTNTQPAEEVKNASDKCSNCGGSGEVSITEHCPECKGSGLENASGLMKHFTFRDVNGEEETVEAADENAAWEKLAHDFATPLSELKGMGMKLVRQNENTKNPQEQDRILEQIKKSENLIGGLKQLPKTTQNDNDIATEEVVLAGLRRNLTNDNPEGDLSEISRHAEGIEHEVEELAEEGLENCACGCTEDSHKPGAASPCPCACPECSAKKKQYGLENSVGEEQAKEIWFSANMSRLEGLLEDLGLDSNLAQNGWDDLSAGARDKIRPHLRGEWSSGNSINNSGMVRGSAKYGSKKS